MRPGRVVVICFSGEVVWCDMLASFVSLSLTVERRSRSSSIGLKLKTCVELLLLLPVIVAREERGGVNVRSLLTSRLHLRRD